MPTKAALAAIVVVIAAVAGAVLVCTGMSCASACGTVRLAEVGKSIRQGHTGGS